MSAPLSGFFWFFLFGGDWRQLDASQGRQHSCAVFLCLPVCIAYLVMPRSPLGRAVPPCLPRPPLRQGGGRLLDGSRHWGCVQPTLSSLSRVPTSSAWHLLLLLYLFTLRNVLVLACPTLSPMYRVPASSACYSISHIFIAPSLPISGLWISN